MVDLAQDLAWFETWKHSTTYAHFKDRPIAYFCAEYALESKIPTYAGGLGILAGDVIREAADRDVPIVGIGLYYRQGYICPTKVVNGKLVEICVDTPAPSVGLAQVLAEDGSPLKISVPMQDEHIIAHVWKWTRANADVYLLDTDVEPNKDADRKITERLYIAHSEMRLKQQIVLGIGGLRLLEALKIHPSIYHLNEGHSALLSLELIRHQMQERKLSFDQAKAFARRRLVLTNHTLVPAGNEVYGDDLVSLLLERYAKDIAVPVTELVKLGLVQGASSFSMTLLALRMASVVNAVSKLHAKKASEIWHDHPMVAVTNGVHIPTWDRIVDDVRAPGAFWKVHQERKGELLKHIASQTGRNWDQDTLLVGWARRIASYKRPGAILEDAKRFAELARNSDRPMRLIISGRPHAADIEGLKIREDILKLVEGELKDVAAYLPDYNLEQAELLVAGCDVWLNTPVVGFEACGTSGMKAALNGVLPCSTKDGWVDEAELYKVGWLLKDADVATDVLDVLEQNILPMYYDRAGANVPALWEEHMRNSRDMILNQFSATRMLRSYIEMMYL